MSFNGNEGSPITLADAADLTANYRATISPGNRLLDILNQTGCMGVRIYFGLDKNGEQELVLVGADSNEQDMEKGVIIDQLTPCPTICSSSNPLNS